MKRVAIAAMIGAAVGLTVSTLIGIPFLDGPAGLAPLLENAFTDWGIFFGGFAALATFGFVLIIVSRHSRGLALFGRIVVIATLTLLAALTWWWIAAWTLSPFTLEGLWIYPLAMVPTVIVVWMLWSRLRTRRAAASARID